MAKVEKASARRGRKVIRMFGASLGGLVLVLLIVEIVALALASAPWRGPASDHFDGERFFTPHATGRLGSGFLRWAWERRPPEWGDVRETARMPAPPARVAEGRPRLTLVGHATWLIQMDGLNILTDPIWSDRASPLPFAGPKRRQTPGIAFDDLPPIDVVLLSHNHYDHLDLPTLEKLDAKFRPLIITGLGNGAYLEARGYARVKELDWWQEAELPNGRTAMFVPAQHFSQRSLHDRNRTLWGGFVLLGSERRVFFAGDTAYGPHFKAIGERLGPIDVALLPIGAFNPEWFMGPVHMGPKEAPLAHVDLRARESFVMHEGVFPLADDDRDEARRELIALLAHDPLRERIHILDFGRSWQEPPAVTEATP